jgi:hypothetical protein
MALVAVAMTLVLVLAVAATLALSTASEAMIAANFRASEQAFYAAEAAAEWAVVDLPAVAADWSTLLTTSLTSGFVDGVAGGSRALADGTFLNLPDVVARNSAWKPYAWGPAAGLVPPLATVGEASPFYIVLFVASGGSAGALRIRSEAFGPRGAHKALELNVFRDAAGVRVVSWAERR